MNEYVYYPQTSVIVTLPSVRYIVIMDYLCWRTYILTLLHQYLSGILSGKYQRNSSPPDMPEGRVTWATRTGQSNEAYPAIEGFNNEKTWTLLDTMDAIARSHGKYNFTQLLLVCLNTLYICDCECLPFNTPLFYEYLHYAPFTFWR